MTSLLTDDELKVTCYPQRHPQHQHPARGHQAGQLSPRGGRVEVD